jgi:hypothetical protein
MRPPTAGHEHHRSYADAEDGTRSMRAENEPEDREDGTKEPIPKKQEMMPPTSRMAAAVTDTSEGSIGG